MSRTKKKKKIIINKKKIRNVINIIKRPRVLKLVGIILLTIILFLFMHNKSSKLVYNKNLGFIRKQVVNDITFDKIKCYYDGKDSLISYKISNHEKKLVKLHIYQILVRDKDDKIISTIFIDFDKELAPNETKPAENKVLEMDLSDARKMHLTIN